MTNRIIILAVVIRVSSAHIGPDISILLKLNSSVFINEGLLYSLMEILSLDVLLPNIIYFQKNVGG
jgi:hypothetical protein